MEKKNNPLGDINKDKKQAKEEIKQKSNQGITLIALVITIIVLLILAAISIATLTGENGILTKANEAKTQTELGKLKEMVQTDILEYQTENRSGDITAEELREILDKYFKDVPEKAEDLLKNLEDPEYSLRAKDEYGEDIEIKVLDLYKGDLTTGTVDNDPRPDADLEVSYVGYYADFEDADGNPIPDGNPDGIIYADLAVKKSGTVPNPDFETNGVYEYGYETEEEKAKLKKYKISEEKVTGFGTWEEKMLTLAKGTSGEDRFYVMALKDLDESEHYWYYNANYEESLDKPVAGNRNDFGEGKTNTTDMIEKYKSGAYGEPYEDGTYTDLWGLDSLKEKVSKGWFVPSKSEWAAFMTMYCESGKVGEGLYQNYVLEQGYWSSSQNNINSVWKANYSRMVMERKRNYFPKCSPSKCDFLISYKNRIKTNLMSKGQTTIMLI